MDKWLNEAYKDCQQTHYKFVDEGSNHNGPMVMKRKRSRVMLTPEEREEISNFLADNRLGFKKFGKISNFKKITHDQNHVTRFFHLIFFTKIGIFLRKSGYLYLISMQFFSKFFLTIFGSFYLNIRKITHQN